MKYGLAGMVLAALGLPAAGLAQDAAEHAGHDMSQMQGHDMQAMAGMQHAMRGALGDYASTREASGTAWQPDTAQHDGVHVQRGDWMLMGHATLDLVFDHQDGARGDEKTFLAGMLMGSAQRPLNGGVLQFRGMLSPDPLMGRRGYPLLLATGETADGVTPLVDRQHPHDLFMELSASYSHPVAEHASVFVYGGLPGEPAFGPPAFMHRQSIMASPEAPISHHWLDSTHIVFGVVTAGAVWRDVKLEASRFRGREPDEDRYDIETGGLDSTAVRLSWNPVARLALQASWAQVASAEQLEPELDQRKWSASALYTQPLAGGRWWSGTVAWGRRTALGGHDAAAPLDAFVLEAALSPAKDWVFFARAERTENDELQDGAGGGHHGPAYEVAKLSAGAVRDFRVAARLKFGVGAQYAWNFVPAALESEYRGDPGAFMAFLRLRVE